MLSLTMIPAAPSFAAPPGQGGEDLQATARARGEEGLRLFEESKWEQAYDAFQAADTLYHAPTLVLYMGHCRRNQGKLLEARAIYEKAAAEPVPKGAPDQFGKAVMAARTELDNLKQRIPTVRVSISGAPAKPAQVTIDGAALSAAEQESGKELDPGSHEILAEAAGGASARRKITVRAGEAAWVELVLTNKAAKDAPPPPRPGSRLPAGIALGAGGVGVAVGVITGSVALAQINDIRSRCTDSGHCLKSDEPKAETAKRLTVASTIGFVTGGVGLAAGAILWVLRPGGEKAKARAKVELRFGAITLEGQF